MGQGILSDFIVIGKVGAPFGIKGWVHVQSFTAEPKALLGYNPWYLKQHGEWQPVAVLEAREQGKHFVARLEGLESRDSAALYTNKDIGVSRSMLPPLAEGEFYWNDLIGLEVVLESGHVLGRVDSIFETGANDVLVVKGGGKEQLIPYIPSETILKVDLNLRQIRVKWDSDF